MRRYHYLVAVGTLLMVAGFAALLVPTAYAQDAPEEPPFLAEYYNAWAGSAHADATAEAFVHWDSEGEIPVECARCHSTSGYRDYLGDDGSAAGAVDAAAPLGQVVSCDACHSPSATRLTTVTFPSGAEVTDTGDATRCMVCHQGRASTDSVNAAIAEAGLTEDANAIGEDLGFINIHYYAAAASLYGSAARGGYQYDGLRYQMKNLHVPEFDTCSECHSPHTLEVQVEACATCHEEVESAEDLRFIRMPGTQADYDGDGDMDEGIAEEIETLQEMLYEAIQAYATEVIGTGVVYDTTAYPYWFIDSNGNGDADADEVNGDNRFATWTANLVRAAYNYQVTLKDPGGYAHNPTYHIQLLFDSITALNAEISDPVDLEFAQRTDPGHFDTTAEAFRHWDEDGEVPGTCARCHTAGGLPVYLKNGVNIASEPSNSLACSTCHESIPEFTTYTVDEVRFPSGATLTFGEGDVSNLCLNCHQGRESTVSVNTAITRAGVGDDEVAESLTFRNVHYFAAGASVFGGEAMGGYQYDGKEYSGRNLHGAGDEDAPTTCTGCHYEHEPSNRLNDCEDCHEDVEVQEDVRLIRQEAEGVDPVDYDGDGDDAEPIADEITTLQEALLAAIQSYATSTVDTAVAYDSHTHPYWFIDTNGNGTADPEEVNGDNRFASWTPNILRAAYNYQYSQKDPGAFAHNGDYIMQLLYDSIESVGGAEAVASYTRPAVVASS
jgi:ferredoxin